MEQALALFTPQDLERWVGSLSYKRGASIHKQGGVGTPAVSRPAPGQLRIQARIDDGAVYPRTTYLEWDGKELSSRCDCPLNAKCKHVAALGLAFLDSPGTAGQASASTGTSLLPGQEVLLYGLWPAPPPKKLEGLYHRAQCLWLAIDTARIREDGLPGTSRPLALWGAVPRNLMPEDTAILELVMPFFREHGRDFSSPHARGIPLLENQVNPVLRLLASHPFVFGAGRRPIVVRPDRPVTARQISAWQREEGIWELDGVSHPASPARLVGEDPAWVMLEEAFHPLIEGAPLGEGLADPEALPGGTRAVGEPGMSGDAPLVDPVVHPGVPPVARLTLHEEGEALLVRLTFRYGSAMPVSPTDPRKAVGGERDGEWGFWNRDPQAETALVRRLNATELDFRGDGDWVGWGESALAFLMDDVPALCEEGWEIYGEERLAALRVDRRRTTVSVGISSGTDWFDLEAVVEIEGEALETHQLRDALRAGSRFVRLGSGAFARLPEEWLARQRALAEALGMDPTFEGGVLRQRIPRYQALAAGELLEVADRGVADETWRAFVKLLENFEGIAEQPLPDGFRGELRGYQHKGLDYLCFLRDQGINGILADDMGLGKTIQAIALLLREQATQQACSARLPHRPTLLVAPTSVVYNWEQELARFAPSLTTVVLHGADRHERFDRIAEADVVVTSYALLRRDFEVLREHVFHYVILDEAQMIKNPRSQAARAAYRLHSAHRLCLTGTPIENNLLELWSLFQFLMPGYLGSEKRFRTTYLGSGTMGKSPELVETLRKRTRPFILRRLKQEVATDLPPRSEIVSFCELDEQQRRFYDELLAQVRMEVLGTVDRLGLSKSRFNVLEGLLRLRQACCDPQLVRPTSPPIPSGKVEHFMELLSEILAGGHRVLVFSQFVKVLQILQKRLIAEEIPYEYLDGQVKDRLERVERFNASDTPVFLISLKAGGTGLNLTGADYVIHFDPWWNPAVEDQATDRAHRIGQTRHVFAYKLIAKDTVEEKVLALQSRKRQMIRDVLGSDDLGQSLTREDLEFLFS